MQRFSKTPPGAAGVVATELLQEFFIFVDDALAAFDVRLGGSASALAGALERRANRLVCSSAWPRLLSVRRWNGS